MSNEEGVPGHVVSACRRGSYPAARIICRSWHGGSDHNITGLSHGREWSSFGLSGEVSELLGHEKFGQKRRSAIAELEALREFAEQHGGIHVFDTLHGHRFMDSDGYGTCLTCGAHYELVHTSATDITRGRYRNSQGKDPVECTGFSRAHGADECPAARSHKALDALDDTCRTCEESALNPCNCLYCTG